MKIGLLDILHFLILPFDLRAGAGESPFVLPQEAVLKGLAASGVNLDDPIAVFATVFASLPERVSVLPTENYYYWQMFCDGREIRGNIRLPSGQREKGVICIGYAEYDEFPDDGSPAGISASRYLGLADGITVTCVGPFLVEVLFRGKTVRFSLLELEQRPPANEFLGPEERFVARTYDESGCRFFLIYNTRKKCFFWFLNEENTGIEKFQELGPGCLLGCRTGFVFWVDRGRGDRKVLALVRGASVRRNDWFDGPFDQLADNYADQVNIRKFMEEALPSVKGRIDKWGYFTDTPKPERVALNHYGTWDTVEGAVRFVTRAVESGDPAWFISRRGVD